MQLPWLTPRVVAHDSMLMVLHDTNMCCDFALECVLSGMSPKTHLHHNSCLCCCVLSPLLLFEEGGEVAAKSTFALAAGDAETLLLHFVPPVSARAPRVTLLLFGTHPVRPAARCAFARLLA
jgi:hypothetical protein